VTRLAVRADDRLARAEQGAGQRVVLAVHLSEDLGEVGVTQHRGALPGPQRHQDRAPDQFLDEGRRDAFTARHHLVQVGVDGHVARVDLKQAPTGLRVGTGDLDGQVDTPRAVGQRGLQDVGAVRGERERDVGVRADAVHRVQQGEQQRVPVLREVTIGGDQVDVLQHHHRRLQPPGQCGGLIDEPDRPAGEQDDRAAGQASGQTRING
jgi:hypothetical protein